MGAAFFNKDLTEKIWWVCGFVLHLFYQTSRKAQNLTKMKTEKAIKNVQILNFPNGLIEAIKDKDGWKVECITKEEYVNMSYAITYFGKVVLRFERMYGFGFGNNAAYFNLRMSVIKLLKSVYGGKINYETHHALTGESYEYDSVFSEYSYSEESA